jgi:hypothetical protein
MKYYYCLYLSYFAFFKKLRKENDPETSATVLISLTTNMNIIVIYNFFIGLKQSLSLTNSKVIFIFTLLLLVVLNSKYNENIDILNREFSKLTDDKIAKMRMIVTVHIILSMLLILTL